MVAFPFLTTGKNELIGVVYLEANLGEVAYSLQNENIAFLQNVDVPVMANANLELGVVSSDLKTVKTQQASFKQGDNAALIFGKTGTVIPPEDEILKLYLTDNEGVQTFIALPTGPLEENL